MSKPGDQLRAYAQRIEQAAMAAGLSYLGKRYKGFDLRGSQAKNAPVRDHFKKTNAARYGYAPLSERYAQWKRGRVGDKPILVFTGTLRETSNNGAVTYANGVITITWTNIPEYGSYHHHGGGNLPRRSPYEPDEKNIARMRGVFQDFLDTAAKMENATARGAAASREFM
jgi:hypothetical protein